MAKMVNFGVAYGMSDFGLAERLHIRREDGAPVHRRLLRGVRGHPPLHVEIQILRPRPGLRDHPPGPAPLHPRADRPQQRRSAQAGERMAINMPIQGTAADGIKIAMVGWTSCMHEREMRPGCCSRCTTSSCSRPMRTSAMPSPRSPREMMEGALPLDVPLTVDLKVGADWERMDRSDSGPRSGGFRRVTTDAEEAEVDEPVLALRRCRSCPRSRPWRATCKPGCRAPRSPMPRCAGSGRSAIRSRPTASSAELRGGTITPRRAAGEERGPAAPRRRARDDRRAAHDRRADRRAAPGTPHDPHARVVFRPRRRSRAALPGRRASSVGSGSGARGGGRAARVARRRSPSGTRRIGSATSSRATVRSRSRAFSAERLRGRLKGRPRA